MNTGTLLAWICVTIGTGCLIWPFIKQANRRAGERLVREGQTDDPRDALVFAVADQINAGKEPLDAMLRVADKFHANKDVIYVCDMLVKFTKDKKHPFTEAAHEVMADKYLSFLTTARLNGADFSTAQKIQIYLANL